jgi:hypothetical protein
MKEAQQLKWENDPSLVPMTPQRQKAIDNAVHRTLQRQGVKPEELPDQADRKEYAAWLKANPAEPQ